MDINKTRVLPVGTMTLQKRGQSSLGDTLVDFPCLFASTGCSDLPDFFGPFQSWRTAPVSGPGFQCQRGNSMTRMWMVHGEGCCSTVPMVGTAEWVKFTPNWPLQAIEPHRVERREALDEAGVMVVVRVRQYGVARGRYRNGRPTIIAAID